MLSVKHKQNELLNLYMNFWFTKKFGQYWLYFDKNKIK